MIVKIKISKSNSNFENSKFQCGIWNLEFDLTLRRRTAVRLYDVPCGNKK